MKYVLTKGVYTNIWIYGEQKDGECRFRKAVYKKSYEHGKYYIRYGFEQYKTNNATNYFFKVKRWYTGIKFAINVRYYKGQDGLQKKARFHAELYRKPHRKVNGKPRYYHKTVEEGGI